MAKSKRKGRSSAQRTARRPKARRAAPPRTHASPRKDKGQSHRATSARRAATPIASKRVPMFQVDAFTSRLFHGNPAAVVLIENDWPLEEIMQAVAAENNLSETAFVLPKGMKEGSPRFDLRWFTPTREMDLCGHATLAAAHVLWRHVGVRTPRLVFDSASGPLPVEREGDLIVLDFPARPGEQIPVPAELCAALGRAPFEVYKSRDLMAVFDNRRDIYEMTPDFHALAQLDALGVIVTAPGSGHDFVSRFFAPRAGVNEDPVTGSAHCTLTPYWSDRLGKPRLTAHQVSKRSGEIMCEDRGTRVGLGGRCVTYLDGAVVIG